MVRCFMKKGLYCLQKLILFVKIYLSNLQIRQIYGNNFFLKYRQFLEGARVKLVTKHIDLVLCIIQNNNFNIKEMQLHACISSHLPTKDFSSNVGDSHLFAP